MHAETAHVARPCQGETVSGDRAFVARTETVFVVAVIDALGHGPRADEAAVLAETALRAGALSGASLDALFEAVHGALRGSRGAAMTVVRGEAGTLETAGVGNVGLRVIGTSLGLVATPGVLGAQHRTLRVMRAPLGASARLVLFSDGLSSRLDLDAIATLSAENAAARLFSSHAVRHDDATVLVADVRPR